ncbi:hypothetical protein LIER_43678 [Lithospermum erythrorhizon]|uniref:Reverse transcriptase domain-containing protein n=1 Tax=Lithospermum erythrorhizon TaxID=34254 RepID=A0AAV3QM35_LITER
MWLYTPSRGLRQGDPLSPYLYILCTEGLIALINSVVARGEWNGVRVGRNGPVVSHWLFADDALLFAGALVEECRVVKEVLQQYKSSSGQRVNYAKSAISFSLNVGEDLRRDICGVLGVAEVSSHAKYLGLPTVVGRSKVEVFASITAWCKEKMCQPKDDGDLGFKSLIHMNTALLAKQAWRLVEAKESMLALAYKAKYYPEGNFWNAMVGSSPSFI